MEKLKYILLFFTVVSLSACNLFDDELDEDENNYKYGNYNDSPVKSVACKPQFAPQTVSDGSIVTITYSDKTYNFVKIFPDGTTKTTPLNFTWSESNSFHQMQPSGDMPSGNKPSGDVSGGGFQQPTNNFTYEMDADFTTTMFLKNCNDEYYLSHYNSNDFGRYYYAVVKFDKDCNIVFQIDSTVNAMGGGPMGGASGTVTKTPVAGTPLNNGGYAMIMQAVSVGMMQNEDYNLTLRIINTEGKIAADYTLEFSEIVKIVTVLNVNNNIAVYYQLSDNTNYVNLYTLNGQLLGILPSDSNRSIYTYITYGEYVLTSGYDSEIKKFFLQQLDQYGQTIQDETLDVSAVVYSITEFDGKRCYSGVLQTDFDPETYDPDNYLDYIVNSDGLIMLNDNGEFETPIIADYNNGVIIYAVFKNDDNTYTIYLSQITPLATLASRLGGQMYVYRTVASRLCDKILIYRTDDLKKLEVN